MKNSKKVFLISLTVGGILAYHLLKVSLYKNYSIDEFTYAHAGWLISKGELPYRDFFCHHFPLGYFIFSFPFLLFGDHPANIVFLRIIMWPFIIFCFYCCCKLNSRNMGHFFWFTGVLLISIPGFVIFSTEARPDLMSLSIYSIVLCLCFSKYNYKFLHGLLIGSLFALSICFSEKALCYGSVIIVGILIDVFHNSKQENRFLIGRPYAVVVGFSSIFIFCLLFLKLTGSFDGWLNHSIYFTLNYQKNYSGFSWKHFFWPAVIQTSWLIPFSLIGASQSFLKWLKTGKERWHDPDILLIVGIFTTFLSYSLQKQAYTYSLLPLFFVLSIFSARGIYTVIKYIQKNTSSLHNYIIAILAISAFIHVFNTINIINGRLEIKNHSQIETLKWIESNTKAGDFIYDNSGSYISRNHASFYYFTNNFMRIFWKDFLNKNIPLAIKRTGTTIFIRDSRYDSLPIKLRIYLKNNFIPFDNNIWIWGKKFKYIQTQKKPDQFYANQTGNYFVVPSQASLNGNLYIDGKKINEPIFALKKGHHDVKYSGSLAEFHIIWLPINEKPFLPIKSTNSNFAPIL